MKKEIIKPFDFEKAKNGAKLQTKEGYPVEIFKWDARGVCPIKGIIKEEEQDLTAGWDSEGFWRKNHTPHSFDLVIVEEIEEPEFKVKDWVIDKQGIVHQIANVIMYDNNNTYGYDIVGGGYFNDNTEGVRLWTLDDAKAGDVLSWDDSKCITIFKNIYDKDSFNSYGFVGSCTGTFESRIAYHDIKGAHPATKEQRDLLFSKLTEAGYEWDAEKLELKKIKSEFWSDDENKRFNGFKIELGGVQKADDFYNLPNAYHIFATEKQAKSALAMARISQIMANDIENFGGVVTDKEWKSLEWKYVIDRYDDRINTVEVRSVYHFLAFHTEKQRDLFLEKYPQLVRDFLMISDGETK